MPSSPIPTLAATARGFRDRRRPLALLTGLALAMPLAVVPFAAVPAAAAPGDLALAGTASASAAQDDADGSFPASATIDGDPATRWASGNGPDEEVPFRAWLQVDLGAPAAVDRVVLAWEAAYAADYDIQVATTAPEDETSWTTVQEVPDADGGTDDLAISGASEARYVRVLMNERVSFDWDPARPHWYGYSLFSFEVYGTPSQVATVFGTSGLSVPAGETATVPVVLAVPATADTSVRVRSTGGTASAPGDYTAVDEIVTFTAGETAASVSVATVDHGPLSPPKTIGLTLSDPSAGLVLGARATATLTVTPHGELPDVDEVEVLDDFESGVPAGYTTWGINADVTPVLSAPEAARDGASDGNHALVATVGATPAPGDWFGFTHDISPTDWSDYDGFTFWFLGTGGGGLLRYELKSGGQLFERSVTDDTAGWRRVNVPFAQLRLKGNPTSDARFDPTASTGFAVTLTDLGAGAWTFDDIALYTRATTLDDAEGDVPFAEPGTTVGLFTWGSDGSVVGLGATERDRDGAPAGNHVLSGDYLIPSGGWGGYSHNLEAGQDWSSYRGIRLLWYASQDTRPASPTAGADIKVEIKDGGTDGEHAELWYADFKDNWSPDGSRWKVVELPFDQFQLGGYQPGDAATRNGTLDLTASWGYAVTFVPGTAAAVDWAIDDVELYGSAAPVATAVVSSPDVTLVEPGETASVPVTVTSTDGEPLTADIEVTYADAAGTAEAGTHYEATSGSLVFPAGTASGSSQTIDVPTLATAPEDVSRSLVLTLEAAGATVPTQPRVVLNAVGLAYLDDSLTNGERVQDLLARMTLAEKIGQMAQAERLGLQSPDQIATLGLGSVLSGGGSVPPQNTAAGWADMVDAFQRQALSTRLQIPLIYGVDAVHGHNNVVGATIFPHNQGLGATRDPDLVEAASRATAEEVRATGVPWTFAPCLCVSRDERWGRSYESFGEDPALVRSFAEAATVGLQGEDPGDITGADEVLATAKHWVGDGGTTYVPQTGSGYPIDQGVTRVGTLEELRTLHVEPYEPAMAAGVGSMMPSYSAVSIAGGEPVRMHENGALNNDLLKGELGFDGFLVSDWEGIDKLPGGTYAEKAARSVNAGVDMAMAPYNFAAFIDAVAAGVGAGVITEARVDDAVTRILTQKFALGLFDQPFADRSGQDAVGGAEHRAVAREAAGASQVLLKNADGVLPLAKDAKIYLAGSNADDLGNQAGGWTISWQGGSGDITQGTSILEGIAEVAPGAAVTYSEDASAPIGDAGAGIVVVGETPYAEGVGDVGNSGKSLSLSAADRAAIDTVCAAVECVVLVVAGRPQLVSDQLPDIDALVASWLPGSEGAGVADALFGDRPFTGRLPVTWPASAEQVPINAGDEDYDPEYAYGWGLRTDSGRDRLDEAVAGLPAGDARDAVQAILDADVWSGEDLDPASAEEALALIADAAAVLGGEDRATARAAGLVVSLVRDLAQDAVVTGRDGLPSDAEAITADAEHALMAGDPGTAVALLAEVAGIEAVAPVASAITLSVTRAEAAFGSPATARVLVTADGALPGGTSPTGTVAVLSDGVQVATIDLAADGDGRAVGSAVLPANLAVGAHTLTAEYPGSESSDPPILASESAETDYRVVRAEPELSTDGTRWVVRRSAEKVVDVQVEGVAGAVPTGTVEVWVNAKKRGTATLGADGTTRIPLPKSTGTGRVVVRYAGDGTFAPTSVGRILLVL
ncbi:glycoside hydrolase family 3 N-terminal domain-containing protein [Micromonospora sp. DT81.3]|uniref:glycoside hydrolase family 3 N-terminal domain-containing protein n=1 Tax=Micromonospora sp. DT81.3 TaxID=3416523 RepID=UPI003CE854FF